MKVFFDCEFTGLHQDTKLISIGCVAENGWTFYAESNEYREDQLDDWLKENVIANMAYIKWKNGEPSYVPPLESKYYCSTSEQVRLSGSNYYIGMALSEWLLKLSDQKKIKVNMVGDCLAYDWMLLMQLIGIPLGSGLTAPDTISYIPLDLCTLMWTLGYDPDTERIKFSQFNNTGEKHNALFDAKVIRDCYERIYKENCELFDNIAKNK